MFRWIEKPQSLARELLAWLGVVVFRRRNPLAAVLGIGYGFARPVSSARAWSVGIAVTSPVVAVVQLILPGFIDRHQWIVLGPVVFGALSGHAAYSEADVVRAATLGLWRTVKLAAVVFACALIIAIIVGVVFALEAFFHIYGILGVIVILLGLIVIQLQRLISSGHGLSAVAHTPSRASTDDRLFTARGGVSRKGLTLTMGESLPGARRTAQLS